MRVIFTQNFADDRGGFAVTRLRGETQLTHCVKHAAVDGFETVAHVRQSAGDDDTHRVVEVGLLHFLFQDARPDIADFRGYLFRRLSSAVDWWFLWFQASPFF